VYVLNWSDLWRLAVELLHDKGAGSKHKKMNKLKLTMETSPVARKQSEHTKTHEKERSHIQQTGTASTTTHSNKEGCIAPGNTGRSAALASPAGYNARTEPSYTSVGVAVVGRQGVRADMELTLPPPHGVTLLDISIIHPRCPTYVAAASETRGAAATHTRMSFIPALRDRSKYWAHAGHVHPGHPFVPVSVETCGHLCMPIMRCLRTLSDIPSALSLTVTRGSYLAGAHRELSVALLHIQGFVCSSCALLLAKASGQQVLPGADTPCLD
jgi:hypothetical protein